GRGGAQDRSDSFCGTGETDGRLTGFHLIELFQGKACQGEIKSQRPSDVPDMPGFPGVSGDFRFPGRITQDEAEKSGVSGQPFPFRVGYELTEKFACTPEGKWLPKRAAFPASHFPSGVQANFSVSS